MRRSRKLLLLLTLCLPLWSCSKDAKTSDSVDDFVKYVEDRPVGSGADQWLEMQNMYGEWEKTVLIFGYYTDSGEIEECQNIAEALKNVNPSREYRCTPVNR